MQLQAMNRQDPAVLGKSSQTLEEQCVFRSCLLVKSLRWQVGTCLRSFCTLHKSFSIVFMVFVALKVFIQVFFSFLIVLWDSI